MNKRQETILKYISDKKSASVSDIQQLLTEFHESISRITIIRDLGYLLENNHIRRKGQARGTKYYPIITNPLLEYLNIDSYFQKDSDERIIKNKNFCFNVFNHLSSLFTDKELNEIHFINEKFRHNFQKLTPTIIKKEFERLTIELSWKSSHIEGNTYSLLDTERLIKENIEASGHLKEESIMILNHKRALDYIFQDPLHYKTITLAKIDDIHRLLVDNLDVSTGLRSLPVGIVGTNYKPLDNIYQIKEAMDKLINIINDIQNPFEKALIVVLMIAYIQPFEDGNKRTSRILANAILIAHDYCPLSYRSIDEVEYKKAVILFYEQNSAQYFKQLFIEQFKQAVEIYF